jgi:hypothetical protein
MSDYIKYENLLEQIAEMVDEHSIISDQGVREFNTESMNYEELKALTCNKILQLLLDIDNDTSMSELDKFVSIASSMSYLAMENFTLHYLMLLAQSEK